MPNLRPKIFWNFFLYQALMTLKFYGGIWTPTFFGNPKFDVKNFFLYRVLCTLNFWVISNMRSKILTELFPLLNTQDFEFFREGEGLGTNFSWSCQIWGKKFFRIFSLTKRSGLWIYWRVVQAPTFFSHSKFEVKHFWEFFPFPSALVSEFVGAGCLDTNIFWSCQIWGQKFFRIVSFIERTGLWIFHKGWGSSHQLFLVMPNLRFKPFQKFFMSTPLWTLNFWDGGLFTNFFGHSKFEVIFQNFFLYQNLWTLNLLGRFRHQLFLVMPNLMSRIFQNFFLALLTEFFRGGVQTPTFFGNSKFSTKNFLEFFPFVTGWG